MAEKAEATSRAEPEPDTAAWAATCRGQVRAQPESNAHARMVLNEAGVETPQDSLSPMTQWPPYPAFAQVNHRPRTHRYAKPPLPPPTPLLLVPPFHSHTEFPDLAAGPATLLEVGCGVGNTVFPLLEVRGRQVVGGWRLGAGWGVGWIGVAWVGWDGVGVGVEWRVGVAGFGWGGGWDGGGVGRGGWGGAGDGVAGGVGRGGVGRRVG